MDQLDTLSQLIIAAVKIDNRLFERSIERKGHYSYVKAQTSKPKKGYWL